MKNNRILPLDASVLSENWGTLIRHTYKLVNPDGVWEIQDREVYDRSHESGFLIETCAGLLDADDPVSCIRKETLQETGFRIEGGEKVLEAYMSPGSVTELIHFFVAEYGADQRVASGGFQPENRYLNRRYPHCVRLARLTWEFHQGFLNQHA